MSVWRPEFEAALRLFAAVSEAVAARGLPRPILVGGAAVELYTASAISTGDFDLCSPVQEELEEELRRHGFVRPSGAGVATRGWIHPAFRLGFEVVSSAPLDGAVDPERIRIVTLDETGDRFRVLAVEDMIADRMGQVAAEGGRRTDMLAQARALRRLYPDLDITYLDERVRYESGGDYGAEDTV